MLIILLGALLQLRIFSIVELCSMHNVIGAVSLAGGSSTKCT